MNADDLRDGKALNDKWYRHQRQCDYAALKDWLWQHRSELIADAGRYSAVVRMSTTGLSKAKLLQRGLGDDAFHEVITRATGGKT